MTTPPPSVRDSTILYTFENNLGTGDEHPRREVNFDFACRPCRERQRVDPAHKCRSTMILRPGDEFRQECNLPPIIPGPLAMLTQDSRVISASTPTEERHFPGASSIQGNSLSRSELMEMFDSCADVIWLTEKERRDMTKMQEATSRRVTNRLTTILVFMLAAAINCQPPQPELIARLEQVIAYARHRGSHQESHQESRYSGLNTTFVSEEHFMTRPNRFPIYVPADSNQNNEDGVQALMSNYLTVDMDAIRDSSDENPASEMEEVD